MDSCLPVLHTSLQKKEISHKGYEKEVSIKVKII